MIQYQKFAIRTGIACLHKTYMQINVFERPSRTYRAGGLRCLKLSLATNTITNLTSWHDNAGTFTQQIAFWLCQRAPAKPVDSSLNVRETARRLSDQDGTTMCDSISGWQHAFSPINLPQTSLFSQMLPLVVGLVTRYPCILKSSSSSPHAPSTSSSALD